MAKLTIVFALVLAQNGTIRHKVSAKHKVSAGNFTLLKASH